MLQCDPSAVMVLKWPKHRASQGKTGPLRIVKFGAFEFFDCYLSFETHTAQCQKGAPCDVFPRTYGTNFLLCSYVATSNDTPLDLFVLDA